MGITKPCNLCTGYTKLYNSVHCYYDDDDYRGNRICSFQAMEMWKCQECDKITEPRLEFIHFYKPFSEVTDEELIKTLWNLGFTPYFIVHPP